MGAQVVRGLDAITLKSDIFNRMGVAVYRKRVIHIVLASSLVLGGCASVDKGEGQYLQVGSLRSIFGEFDLGTTAGCHQELAAMRLKPWEQKDFFAKCSTESASATLPVVGQARMTKTDEVITSRWSTRKICEIMAENLNKNAGISFSCLP